MEGEAAKQTLFYVENALYPFIAAIGIVANIFVIVVVLIWEKSRANRTVANMFIVNLAIADLLFLVVLPFNMPALTSYGWIYGSFMCKLIEVLKYINYRASISFLTTMTVDRYLAIVYSLESREYRTRRNAVKICIFLWLLSLLLSIPLMVYTGVENTEDSVQKCSLRFPGYEALTFSETQFYDEVGSLLNISDYSYNLDDVESIWDNVNMTFDDYNDDAPEYSGEGGHAANSYNPNDGYVCYDGGHEKSAANTAWVYSNFVLFFLIPIIIILFCYGSIIKATMRRDIPSTKPNSTTSFLPSFSGAHIQVTVMVAVLVIVFIACWLPFQAFALLILPPGIKLTHLNDCLIIKSALEMLAWSNSAINPILYSISSRRFRDKAVVAWVYIRHGHKRAVAMQISQRTMQTKLQTNVGTSRTSMKCKSVVSPDAKEQASTAYTYDHAVSSENTMV